MYENITKKILCCNLNMAKLVSTTFWFKYWPIWVSVSVSDRNQYSVSVVHFCMALCSLFIPFFKLIFLLKDHQKFGIQLWPKVKETWIWSASKLVKNVWLLLLLPMKWLNQSRSQKNIKWRRTKSKCNCLVWTFTLI